MYDKVVSKESFMLKFCPGRYKAQKMCHKAVSPDKAVPASIEICS